MLAPKIRVQILKFVLPQVNTKLNANVRKVSERRMMALVWISMSVNPGHILVLKNQGVSTHTGAMNAIVIKDTN